VGKGARLKKARRARAKDRVWQAAALRAASDEPNSITLVIETSKGLRVRRIAPATPLSVDLPPGLAAEEATHSAAARWGLRLCRAPSSALARCARDGRAFIGDLGVMLQVKRREKPTGDPQREPLRARRCRRSDRHRNIRLLKVVPAQVISARERAATIDLHDVEWMTVVVIDHEKLPEHITVDEEVAAAKTPTLVLLRRDWEFLFGQLKSTFAVVQYVKRVAGELGTEVGDEYSRYYELAFADAQTKPKTADERFKRAGAWFESHPHLPEPPAGYAEDADDYMAFMLTRAMLEDVAVIDIGDPTRELDRLRLLADIDSVPLAYRAKMGRQLLEWLDDVGTVTDALKMQSRRIVDSDSGRQLAFAAMHPLTAQTHELFRAWTLSIHRRNAEMLGVKMEGTRTTAVMLSPRLDGVRLWDTTTMVVVDDPGLDDIQWDGIETFLNAGRIWPPS
jgi:hypothetical protein